MRRWIGGVGLVVLLAACSQGTTVTTEPATSTTTTTLPPLSTATTTTAPLPAPWSATPLDAGPDILTEVWSAAANQDMCSALFPVDETALAPGGLAALRSANFAGGWAVAWDLPDGPGRLATGEYCPNCGRGAYGVAGTGVRAVGNELDTWPNVTTYADGSKMAYQLEGGAAPGSGAPWLASILIPDQGCLYQAWSFLSEAHLLDLVGSLRFVSPLMGKPTPWLMNLPPPEPKDLGAPSWDEPPLPRSGVPEAAWQEWQGELGAPASCPLLYPSDLGAADGARIRRAVNQGEMLVAWDLPNGPGHDGSGNRCADCGRGVIGLGTFRPGTGGDWPVEYTWSDGSTARVREDAISYGVEAFVDIPGFDCTYWVWSHLGQDHLEFLLTHLRRVTGAP